MAVADGIAETAPAVTTESADEAFLDWSFDMLRNRRRREVLRYLADRDSATIGELSDWIASIETGRPTEEVASYERKRVYTSLYQSHLPKMADNGLVEYDQRAGRLTTGSQFDPVYAFLRETEPNPSFLGRLFGRGQAYLHAADWPTRAGHPNESP